MDNNSEYISLQEAAKYCSYSQEYLALRTRQGKLKAVKFGRNWVTKKEWLEEYLQKVEEYNENLKIKKVVAPPENLPVEKIAEVRPLQTKPAIGVRFAFVVALAFVLLATGIVFGKESFKNVYRDIEPYTYIVGGAGDIIAENIVEVTADIALGIPQSFVNVSRDINGAISKLGENMAAISMPEISLREWFSSQTEEIVQNYIIANDFLERKISQGLKAITQFFKKTEKIVEEKLIPRPTKEGLVVIPSTEKEEETVKKIKESFSDEVKVEVKDKTSGIIIPIFKKGEGEKYLYILVPIKN